MASLQEYELHLLSKISESRKQELIDRAGRAKKRVVFHNGVSDHEYHEILSKAFALVSASRDEGFGIPVVEAMEQGTPVIVSDIEIFREIGGNAASYFDPAKPGELADRIRALEVQEAWQSASQLCKAQSAQFNWENSADALLRELTNL